MAAIDRYNRRSVERALELHYGPQGFLWKPLPNGGYLITTRIGPVSTRTLRETYMHVVGLAEGKRQVTGVAA